MTDITKPKLKAASIVLKYRAASGFSATWTAKSGADCPNPQTANQTLVHAAREIARVGAVAGCADEISAAVAEAIQAVRDDAAQAASTTASGLSAVGEQP